MENKIQIKKEGKEIELRSEEVQEVMGSVPHWILRWGIIVLSLIVLVLLIGSWFFKYPDTIAATMTLTGSTPPAAIVAKISGSIKELYIQDTQIVDENEYLAVIENPASTIDMLDLKQWLKQQLLHANDSTIYQKALEQDRNLGSVQGSYSAFIRTLHNYQKFIELNYYPQKIASIQHRIKQNENYYTGMEHQHQIAEQRYQVAKAQYSRDSLLREKNVLSEQDMDNARNQFLQSRLLLESSKSSLQNLQMQITQVQETLLDIEQQYLDNKSSLESELSTSAIQLNNEINTWEMNYVLTSPVKGQITFTSYWSQNQNVTIGETIFTIIPNEKSKLVGKAQLPVARSGKVKIGQKVNIHFLNFPDKEFGMVRGVVKNISLVPIEDNYTVEIDFPNGLMTSYRKELPFSQEMTATIEIITEDLRFLERFFLPVKKIFKEHL